MGLIRPVLHQLSERETAIRGHVFDTLAFLALAFVTSGTIALILTPLAGLAAVITPALQGSLSSLSALAMIISPLVMTGTFATFTKPDAVVYFPGAPFLLSAVLILVGLAVFITEQGQASFSG